MFTVLGVSRTMLDEEPKPEREPESPKAGGSNPEAINPTLIPKPITSEVAPKIKRDCPALL